MGYRGVRSIHGPMEHGKDMVFSQQDPLAKERHYAVVIKRGALSGSVSSSGSLRTALYQIERCVRSWDLGWCLRSRKLAD